MELNGPLAILQHDLIISRAPANLTDAILEVSLGYVHAAGDSHLIVGNGTDQSLAGTFQGLAEGTVTDIGGVPFVIRYGGGDGNGITLTATNLPLQAGPADVTVVAGQFAVTNDMANGREFFRLMKP